MQSANPVSRRLYQRRQPEKTVLYRALAHYFETFLQVYEKRFQPTFGHFRKVIQETVYKFLDCGIFERGFGRARCPKCRQEFLVALSCKLRCICPSCHQKRELLWADWAGEELLEPVPHRFTHLAATYRPVLLRGRASEAEGRRWVPLDEPGVALPVAQQRIARAASEALTTTGTT